MATVLIVDDDPDMRALEKAMLQSSGFDVIAATNGVEALECLERRRPCAILLDLMMPVMDGLTFLDERQHAGNAAGVPVICVSAGGGEMMDEARRRGADDCVPKPADFDELCQVVARYCHGC